MNKKRNWAIALIVSATAGIFALQTVSAPASNVASIKTQAPTSAESPVATFTPTYEACGYMWAYHDDPQLTAMLDEAIRALDPAASANAQRFGEDCIYADGHSTFSTMETNFYIRLPVDDLTTEEKLGDWIKQVMNFVTTLKEDQVQGNMGFVEFSFIKSDVEQIIIRVGIKDYKSMPADTTGRELLQMFHTPTAPPTTPHPTTPTP